MSISITIAINIYDIIANDNVFTAFIACALIDNKKKDRDSPCELDVGE